MKKDIQPFCVDRLMQETRKLACMYRQTTGQTLPVSNEIARYDAKHLLNLIPCDASSNPDFLFQQGPFKNKKVQVKSRVIFDEEKTTYRMGQFKLESPWDCIALILYDYQYEPTDIYLCHKKQIEEALQETHLKQNGQISIAKFKVISQLIWTKEQGLEWDDLWQNHG